jgi:hypothetical protein
VDAPVDLKQLFAPVEYVVRAYVLEGFQLVPKVRICLKYFFLQQIHIIFPHSWKYFFYPQPQIILPPKIFPQQIQYKKYFHLPPNTSHFLRIAMVATIHTFASSVARTKSMTSKKSNKLLQDLNSSNVTNFPFLSHSIPLSKSEFGTMIASDRMI